MSEGAQEPTQAAAEEPVEAAAEAAEAPTGTTQGDIVPGADEHPVDTTPPIAEGDPQGDPHEPMVHESGEPNERGAGGGDGTVWNG